MIAHNKKKAIIILLIAVTIIMLAGFIKLENAISFAIIGLLLIICLPIGKGRFKLW